MLKHSRRTLAALTGLIVGACLLAFSRWRSPPTSPAAPNLATSDERISRRLVPSPCKIGEGLYLFGDLEPAAVYVVETDEGLVMVDTGLEAEYDKIARSMKKFGLDPRRLKLILLTHAHGDHSMGAERLRRETGARVHIGREDAAPLRDGGPWDAIFSKFDMPGVSTHTTSIDGELVDGQVMLLGKTRITAIATPGHTPGSFCYLVEDRDTRVLFTGDTVMSLADGLGTYSAYLPPRFRGDVAAYLGSLKRLRAMPEPDIVLPGHPRSDPFPQDPRLTRQQWHSLLDRGIIELELLATRYTEDGADFLDGTPKQLARGLYYLGDSDGRAAYAYLQGNGTILFDAAGRDAVAFLESAWRALAVESPPVRTVALTSCTANNIAGLNELFESTGCRVLVSPAGAKVLTQRIPDAQIVTTDRLEALGVPGLTGIATPGRDETSAAYSFQVGLEEVLISGETLVELTVELASASRQPLDDGSRQAWDLDASQDSLSVLGRSHPKLWLSARPSLGRNANLYDEEWTSVVAHNAKILRRLRRRPADNAY